MQEEAVGIINAGKKVLFWLLELMQPKWVKLIRKKNNNQSCLGKAIYDLSKVRYYNCNKKVYYINNYIKPSKN